MSMFLVFIISMLCIQFFVVGMIAEAIIGKSEKEKGNKT